jgi:hypothetical protein
MIFCKTRYLPTGRDFSPVNIHQYNEFEVLDIRFYFRVNFQTCLYFKEEIYIKKTALWQSKTLSNLSLESRNCAIVINLAKVV